MSTEISVLPSAVPVPIPGLVGGTKYVLQNQGSASIFAEGAAAAPVAGGPAVRIDAGAHPPHTVELEAGESLYVWGDPQGRVIYNESL